MDHPKREMGDRKTLARRRKNYVRERKTHHGSPGKRDGGPAPADSLGKDASWGRARRVMGNPLTLTRHRMKLTGDRQQLTRWGKTHHPVGEDASSMKGSETYGKGNGCG